jgi:hypothetical protein
MNNTPSHVVLSDCRPFDKLLGSGLILCQDRKDCLNGRFECRASEGETQTLQPLPGYFWCQT